MKKCLTNVEKKKRQSTEKGQSEILLVFPIYIEMPKYSERSM